ncbi:MAG: hypothetical protein ABT19_02225 [Rhodanobacter sp. SCN 68-63]|nr:MAG: hypothetical protein ABT19_02225 [Rhodanobacter sp. SCN 68-63]
MKILILGAGAGPANQDNSVWLAERSGELLVERLVDACANLDAKLIFAVRNDDIKRYSIDSVIKIADPAASIVAITGETLGAPCTALLCAHLIEDQEELLIINGNEFLDADYLAIVENFRIRNLDAGVACFRSIHPRYSYMLLGEDDLIVEAAEKRPISRHATAGFYWFRYGKYFINASQDMIRKDVQIDGKFFISLTFNELILSQKRTGIFEVDARHYFPLKSHQQVATYEASHGEEV